MINAEYVGADRIRKISKYFFCSKVGPKHFPLWRGIKGEDFF